MFTHHALPHSHALSPRFPIPLKILLLAFCLLLLLNLSLPPASAASLTVNTLADNTTNGDGFCTLREALLVANNTATNDCGLASPADDTITFSGAGTIHLTATLPNLTAGAGTVTLDGGDDIILSGDTNNDETGDVRVLVIDSGANVTLKNLTIRDGKADTLLFGLLIGGGVFNQGTLNTLNVNFQQNRADYGGAIYTEGTANLTRTYFSQNFAEVSGGAIDNASTLVTTQVSFFSNTAVALGGGILNFGNLTTMGTAFYDSIANNGAAIYNDNTALIADSYFNNDAAFERGGGIYNANGTLTVTRTTFSGDHANGNTDGGGCIANFATLTVTNSTFSYCQANSFGGGIYNANQATITNSTFSENSAVLGGGGIYNLMTLTLINTILANSAGGSDCVDMSFAVTAQNNLIESDINNCGLVPGVNGNLIGQDPLLGPLNDSGQLVYPLRPGSPAIDAGDNAQCPATDQTGLARPQDGNLDGSAVCDIGAAETVFWVYMPLVIR
ncbi:MAG: CSLREA domain-containing protein [Anaerolineales bacterium]|nr:CSLREA domain-containing protein [Anaerolineales bacterium]